MTVAHLGTAKFNAAFGQGMLEPQVAHHGTDHRTLQFPPVVRRPGSVTFLKAIWIDGELTQGVQLSDESGAVWYAVYHLEQQRDKSWRIAGCDVFPSQGKMV